LGDGLDAGGLAWGAVLNAQRECKATCRAAINGL
jgi:hypothetical protein